MYWDNYGNASKAFQTPDTLHGTRLPQSDFPSPWTWNSIVLSSSPFSLPDFPHTFCLKTSLLSYLACPSQPSCHFLLGQCPLLQDTDQCTSPSLKSSRDPTAKGGYHFWLSQSTMFILTSCHFVHYIVIHWFTMSSKKTRTCLMHLPVSQFLVPGNREQSVKTTWLNEWISWLLEQCWCGNSIKIPRTNIPPLVLELIPQTITQKNYFMRNSKIFLHSSILLSFLWNSDKTRGAQGIQSPPPREMFSWPLMDVSGTLSQDL